MKFSQRAGITPVDMTLQTKGMNDSLRNSIWSVLHSNVFKTHHFLYGSRMSSPVIDTLGDKLWVEFFKKPIDTRPEHPTQVMKALRDWFFRAEWHEIYDFLEFSLIIINDYRLPELLNQVLDRELAGYRYIHSAIVPVTDELEVKALENALSGGPFSGVHAHLKQALHLMSRRENPDYRNSIKESVSAVESLAKELTNNSKATLGDALAVLEKRGLLHGALKRGFSALYGYTSDESGIRHAMLEEPDIGVAEAKYFLISCSCFINYLKARATSGA